MYISLMAATTQGRAVALAKLAERRAANKDKTLPENYNASLYAGSPMFYNCLGCNVVISFPEGWTSRSSFCEECQALKDCGWLE